ncbi:nucleotide exchange factor GrpE [Candidatus Legionella polyplacis]|uniref:Protein GrpE n=1 Tax=Candidatus Legionella polyplacis TaxID=2005262 RepID=A0ABZ2GWM3_9GAMM|nr:nucleotide exchange factor GrpE [Candidatus Legionella polyplacis]ATW02038.1 nucleotide exchange factor GrpE [Candidatus Legionella polyplacis]
MNKEDRKDKFFSVDSLQEKIMPENLDKLESAPKNLDKNENTLSEIDKIKKDLDEAKRKSDENWDRAVRAIAELENFRRRSERDIFDAHRYGISKILIDFLPVIDSLDQALQLCENSDSKIMYEGLILIRKLFLDALIKHGVVEIFPKGEKFNPEEHEAMSIQESEALMDNTVISVFQKGYKLYDRVIRPARVIVAKSKIV